MVIFLDQEGQAQGAPLIMRNAVGLHLLRTRRTGSCLSICWICHGSAMACMLSDTQRKQKDPTDVLGLFAGHGNYLQVTKSEGEISY